MTERSLRALILSQHFWPESFQINDIAKTLAAKGVEVEVLTGKPNYPAGKIFPSYKAWGCQSELMDGIPVHRVPLIPRRGGALWLALNYLSFVLAGLVFGPWLLRGRRIDVIFVYASSPLLQALPALFLGWLKGCPTVVWVQDLWPQSLSATGYVKNRLVLKAVEQVVRFIYRRTDLLLVQSEAFVAPVRALAGDTPIVYHPNSVDERFAQVPQAAPPKVAGMDAPFSVLFAGNIGTAQAVQVILEAATCLRHLPDIAFVVLGDGSRRAWLLEEAAKRGLGNLHLPGRFPVETMPAFMRQASALLVTLADEEIFSYTVPSKVQAYLAAGRPLLACLNGEGARLVQAAGAGLTAPAEDGQALADAVLRLSHMSDQERQAMGERAFAYHLEHFAHDMLVDRLIVLLGSCRGEQKEKTGYGIKA